MMCSMNLQSINPPIGTHTDWIIEQICRECHQWESFPKSPQSEKRHRRRLLGKWREGKTGKRKDDGWDRDGAQQIARR